MSFPLIADHFVARETTISAAINATISAGFLFALFGWSSSVGVRDAGSFALDFLPQSFAVVFFAYLVPSLLTRQTIRQGRVICPARTSGSVAALRVVAVLSGLLALLLGGGAWAAAPWASGSTALQAVPALFVEVVYGSVLGAVVTRYHLQKLLSGGLA